jgi:hypothetical protein
MQMKKYILSDASVHMLTMTEDTMVECSGVAVFEDGMHI